jgi:hypothetical protein
MTPEARERSFDELSRALASGSLSRRKALRLMGAALVGGALASIPGIAGAAPRPKPPKPPGKSPGKKCTEDSQCQSLACVEGVCGGILQKCHTCPEGCGCAVSEGGVIKCIGCDQLICEVRPVSSCGECDPVDEVCVPERGGFVACWQACSTPAQAYE